MIQKSVENNQFKQLENEGFFILKNSVSAQIISSLQKSINSNLLNLIKKKNKKSLSQNFETCLKKFNQHYIQKYLATKLFNENHIEKLLSEKKVLKYLVELLGPDLEYLSNSELAINVSGIKDKYFVKKYHQEVWSGVSPSSMLIWLPIYLKKGMSTLEIIPGSHHWGVIPNMNREPVKLPKKYKKITLNIKTGSILLMSPFTLHRTIPNFHKEPRFAMPITIRNFYYPQKGNEDLWEFRKLKESVYSKLRKKLGNNLYTPYRTIDINQK